MDLPTDLSILSIFLQRLHDSYLRSILAFWPLLFYAFYQSRHWMSDPSILYPHNITIVEALLEFIFKVHIFLRGALVALWVFRLLRSPWTKDTPLLSPIWPDEPIATSHPPNAFTAWLAHARANPHLNPPVSLNSGLPYGFDYNQLDDNNHTFKIYFDYMPSHIRMQWERSAFEALEAYTTQRAYHLRHIRTHLDSALFRAFPPLRSIFPSPSPSRLARALHTFRTIPWSTLFRSLLLMYIPFWGPNTLSWQMGQTIALILITHVYESFAIRKIDGELRKSDDWTRRDALRTFPGVEHGGQEPEDDGVQREAAMLVDGESFVRSCAVGFLFKIWGIIWILRYLGTGCIRKANPGRGSGCLTDDKFGIARTMMQEWFGWDVNVNVVDGVEVLDCQGDFVRGLSVKLGRKLSVVLEPVGTQIGTLGVAVGRWVHEMDGAAARWDVAAERFARETYWRRWGVVMGCLALYGAVLGWTVREVRRRRILKVKELRREGRGGGRATRRRI